MQQILAVSVGGCPSLWLHSCAGSQRCAFSVIETGPCGLALSLDSSLLSARYLALNSGATTRSGTSDGFPYVDDILIPYHSDSTWWSSNILPQCTIWTRMSSNSRWNLCADWDDLWGFHSGLARDLDGELFLINHNPRVSLAYLPPHRVAWAWTFMIQSFDSLRSWSPL